MTSVHRAEAGQSYEMTNLHSGGGAAGSSAGEGFSQAMQSHSAPSSPQGSAASFHTADEGAGQGMTDGAATPESKGKGKATDLPQTPPESSAAPISASGPGSQGLLNPLSAQGSTQPGAAGPSNWQGQVGNGALGTPASDTASGTHRRASQAAINNPDATIMAGVNRISPDQQGTASSSLATLNQQKELMNGIIAKGQTRPDPSGQITEEGGQPSLMERQNALQGQAINNHISSAKNDAASGANHATALMNQGQPDEAEAHMQKTLTDLNINTSRVTGNAAKLVGASQTLGVRTNALNISDQSRDIAAQSRNISRNSLLVAGSSMLLSGGSLAATIATRKSGG